MRVPDGAVERALAAGLGMRRLSLRWVRGLVLGLTTAPEKGELGLFFAKTGACPPEMETGFPNSGSVCQGLLHSMIWGHAMQHKGKPL